MSRVLSQLNIKGITGNKRQFLNIGMIRFNENTETLEVIENDIVLISVPFERASDSEPCHQCDFSKHCHKSILGSENMNFMKDICRLAPSEYHPDLNKLGVSAEKFYNSIKGKIIKKLPTKLKDINDKVLSFRSRIQQ